MDYRPQSGLRRGENPHKFVVGYGLDYRQRYRNLPVLGGLKPSGLD